MAILARKTEGNYELPPEGTFQGVVFAVYDGGMRTSTYEGNENTQHKIKIGIELNETYETGNYAGQRITRYPEYTVSLGDKAKLLPVVESIMGRALTVAEKNDGFDLENLIGRNCQVTILHKTSKTGKLYADNTIGALMKGTPKITPLLKSNYMPPFIQKWIAEGQPIGINDYPTHEDVLNSHDNTNMQKMKDEIKLWIDTNYIDSDTVNKIMIAEAGSLVPWGKLNPGIAEEIYNQVKHIVEMTCQKDLAEGTGFDPDTEITPPSIVEGF